MSEIESLVDQYGPKGQWKELGAVLDGMDRRHLAAGEQEIFEEGVRQFPASGWLNYGLASSRSEVRRCWR
ncbi:MAG: hypothetical protein E6I37_13610 [Chloroflexi bacterium]|nr:MAG: hypothetical protein E6I37_13610 [Chloroflexota bacterium]